MSGFSPLDGIQYLPCAVNTLSSPAVQDNTPHLTIPYIWINSHTLKIQQCLTNTFLPPEQLLLPRSLHWLSKGNNIP